MAQKPSIPKGTRDFGFVEMARRNYIFDTIRSVYRLYGFSQIETPAMENLSTLMGKYGEEGDKLLFKILNSGDFTRSVSTEQYEADSAAALAAKFCEKGLRYDLTVPFARYVVQHREELQLPFKRFQIQPVWRADRPQKGRYREFYQCDADVVGSDSLLNEVELMQIVDEVFTRFGIRVAIKINNRKLLTGIAEVLGAADKIIDITVAIDKLDKIGLDKVNEELMAAGLSATQVETLQPIISLSGSNTEKIATMRQVLAASEVGFTGIFGLPGLSGVGISFGADRIYDVLNQLELYPATTAASVDLLFINFGEKEAAYCLKLARATREAGIATEVFPDATKMKKQMNYANARQIPFVALVGESEMEQNLIALKNMTTGEQQQVSLEQLIQLIHAQ